MKICRIFVNVNGTIKGKFTRFFEVMKKKSLKSLKVRESESGQRNR